MSYNHQYLEFNDKIVLRYTKTIPGIITGARLDPHRPENRTDWLLRTPEKHFLFKPREDGKIDLERISFSYEDEVLELYSSTEVSIFQRLNRATIESGVLVVYNDIAPDIDTSNVLTDDQVTQIAATKQLLAIRKKLTGMTSIHTIQRIIDAAKTLDRPYSIIKAMEERINELSGYNKS